MKIKNITDEGFIKNKILKTLRLKGMTQLTNKYTKNLIDLELLGLENTPQITFDGIIAIKIN